METASQEKQNLKSEADSKMNPVPEEEKDPKPDMTFTRELRKATKDVHKLSDVLVNSKFALALSNDGVWYDALLAFYEIYKYFEENLPEDLLPKELHRTKAFEKDLAYFYGEDWKETYEPRDSVKKYLAHLEEVNEKNKFLLFAYAYQMYMALMSGGQLLQKKRMIARKLWIGGKKAEEEVAAEQAAIDAAIAGDLENRPMPSQVTICPDGCNATYFPEKITIIKEKLRNVLNKHYGAFDEQMRADFIEESRNVFIYNGEVVRSVKGVNNANLRKLAVVLVFVIGVYFALKFARR